MIQHNKQSLTRTDETEDAAIFILKELRSDQREICPKNGHNTVRVADPVFLHGSGSGSAFQISLDPDPVFKFSGSGSGSGFSQDSGKLQKGL